MFEKEYKESEHSPLANQKLIRFRAEGDKDIGSYSGLYQGAKDWLGFSMKKPPYDRKVVPIELSSMWLEIFSDPGSKEHWKTRFIDDWDDSQFQESMHAVSQVQIPLSLIENVISQ